MNSKKMFSQSWGGEQQPRLGLIELEIERELRTGGAASRQTAASRGRCTAVCLHSKYVNRLNSTDWPAELHKSWRQSWLSGSRGKPPQWPWGVWQWIIVSHCHHLTTLPLLTTIYSWNNNMTNRVNTWPWWCPACARRICCCGWRWRGRWTGRWESWARPAAAPAPAPSPRSSARTPHTRHTPAVQGI